MLLIIVLLIYNDQILISKVSTVLKEGCFSVVSVTPELCFVMDDVKIILWYMLQAQLLKCFEYEWLYDYC